MAALPPSDDAWRRAAERWARAELALPEDSAGDELRRRVLDELDRCGLLPEDKRHAAIGVLASGATEAESWLRMSGDFRIQYEAECAKAVERFAREFFHIEIPRRQARYDRLVARCRHCPAQMARLESLRDGLCVEAPTSASNDARVEQILKLLVRSFSLPPPQRQAAEYAAAETARHDMDAWQQAARTALQQHPEVVALSRDFVERLADLKQRVQAEQKQEWEQEEAEWNAAADLARKAERPAGGRQTPFPWWLVPIVLVSINLLRTCPPAMDSRSRSVPYRQDPQKEIERILEDARRRGNGEVSFGEAAQRLLNVNEDGTPRSPEGAGLPPPPDAGMLEAGPAKEPSREMQPRRDSRRPGPAAPNAPRTPRRPDLRPPVPQRPSVPDPDVPRPAPPAPPLP